MNRVLRIGILTTSMALALGACRGRAASAHTDECDAASPMSTGDAGSAPMRPARDGISTYLDDLGAHPGCTVDGLAYTPASIPGYRCAARAYDTPSENTSLPIVLLFHGNSDTPAVWQSFESSTCDPRGAHQGMPMLAERLSSGGFRVYAVDLRSDRVDDCADDNTSCNAAKNMDHGWGVPIAQHFIRSVIEANPGRRISLVGHSFGVTVIRDALRRLWVNESFEVWPHVQDVVLLAGGNHGVSSFPLCASNTTRRGRVTCEMGNRAAFAPTPFLAVLNGPGGAHETPCADGSSAFGVPNACGDHAVQYTTLVMQDADDGTQQDQFVSQASSALVGADNATLTLTEFDQTDYFFCGLFRDHYGPARHPRALDLVVAHLSD